MRPELKQFDLVLFRKTGNLFTDFVGTGIQWAQEGMGVQSPEFVHVGVGMERNGIMTVFETNPPHARYRDLASVDWALGRFRAAGIRVKKEAFTMPELWLEVAASAEVRGDGMRFAAPVAAMPFSVGTPPAGISAPLVDAGSSGMQETPAVGHRLTYRLQVALRVKPAANSAWKLSNIAGGPRRLFPVREAAAQHAFATALAACPPR